ncbi:MAG: ketoacyl-ACP synthase III [Armatimonadetes bacterium]|nr:ketoacyl-ACP synthase III [Armatimonadota bacterium]
MTNLPTVGILGLGSYVPPRIVTNFDLEKMVDTSDEWIRSRTGILTRHVVDDGVTTSDLAVVASLRALESAGTSASEIDLIIVGTAVPDMTLPATACLVQDRIGAVSASAFDLSIGCSGFIYALVVGAQFVRAGAYKKILVIGAETLSKITDWQDRNTCILFGDGAGAVVLGEVPEEEGILSFDLGVDGAGGELLKLPAGGSRQPASHETVDNRLHYLKMRGNEVFKFAVKAIEESALRVLERSRLTVAEVDCFVPHQANVRIIDASAKRLGIPRERVFVNVDRYGNTSSASIPIALDEAVQEKRIGPGSLVLMVGFGGGLSWGSATVRWHSS